MVRIAILLVVFFCFVAALPAAHSETFEVEGMRICMPDDEVLPGSVDGYVMFAFHGKELAQAIPGYVPERQERWHTANLGIVVALTVRDYMSESYLRSLWEGEWNGQKIDYEYDPNSGLYLAVKEEPKGPSRSMVIERPVRGAEQPYLNKWFFGVASTLRAKGYPYRSVRRRMLVDGALLEYNIQPENISLWREVDRFIINRLMLWEQACKESKVSRPDVQKHESTGSEARFSTN